MKFPRILVAAAASGSGKTTATCCLIAGLRARGLRVAAFKTGPDFIDTSHLARAAGRPARNIDPWMAGGAHQAMRLFAAGCQDADIAVIEGVMGLFDGSAGACPESATAGVARLLTAPVIIAFGARGMAETAGPLMRGLALHDPLVQIAGAIPCGTGSTSHAASLKRALQESGVEFLGHIQRDDALAMPERHLGLIPDIEMTADEHLANWTKASADLELAQLIRLADSARELPLPEEYFNVSPLSDNPAAPLLAVARDEAFSFYYQDSLDAFVGAGLRLAFFSPLRDEGLPSDTAGLYLGGGFPELYAEQLSANVKILAAIRRAYAGGMPMLAECGGFMSLCQELEDFTGEIWPMAGIIPVRAIMGKKLASLGYRTGRTSVDSVLGPQGTRIRGHEFHYSRISLQPPTPAFFMERPAQPGVEAPAGFSGCNLMASYLHMYLPGHPPVVQNFAAACKAWAGASGS